MSEEILLTIGIPTFNRAGLLRYALASVLPQVEELADKVECVVSDNASTDGTAEVLGGLAPASYLRVHRQPCNQGCIGNFWSVATELAQGRFLWVIGDDDTVTKGTVRKIVDALERMGDDFDVLLGNTAVKQVPTRNARAEISEIEGGETVATDVMCFRKRRNSGAVEFCDVFDGSANLLTPVYQIVMRRRLWLEAAEAGHVRLDFKRAWGIFPHSCIVAQSQVGKRIWLLDDPITVLYDGGRYDNEWRSALEPSVTCVTMFELLKFYEDSGVPRDRLRKDYDLWIAWAGGHFDELVNSRDPGFWHRWVIVLGHFRWLPIEYWPRSAANLLWVAQVSNERNFVSLAARCVYFCARHLKRLLAFLSRESKA